MRHIAKTLSELIENDVVSGAIDRTVSIEDIAEKLIKNWKVDLKDRNPRPAYAIGIDGSQVYKGTDFDLFTMLSSLAERRAVINLPKYNGIAPKTFHDNQRVISSENRHGEVIGLIASKDTHSFSVRIKDYQVIETRANGSEVVGVPRNFSVVDYNGQLNSGWKDFEFNPNLDEKMFLEEKKLKFGGKPVFENFVHPNLAFAFYGSRYLATKALSQRIEEEARHYNLIAKELRSQGVKLGGIYSPKKHSFKDKLYSEKVIVENLEAKLVLPEFKGKYPLIGLTHEGDSTEYEKLPESNKQRADILRYSERRAKELSYKIGPLINAFVRAVELAYFLNGFKKNQRAYGNEKQPGWDIPEWQRDIRIKPRGAKWNVLDFGDAKLVYRIKEKTVAYNAGLFETILN